MAHASPTIVRDVASLRDLVERYRAEGHKVALVPTMGALREGHISLVTMAQARGARVIVSIFVNPTQFAPTEDFSNYPRPFESDLEKLHQVATDAIYAPDVATMYPPGTATTVKVAGPALAGLEDVSRPFHFDGVATIVAKLFTQVRPDIAVFGEKDFQQLAVVRRMAADLDLGVEVIGAPTLRDLDGLAMSSRNRYLSPADRAIAPALHRIMQDAAATIRTGSAADAALNHARAEMTAAGFELDYLELRDAADLGPPKPGQPMRMLVAAKLGETRLIDNIVV